MTDENPRGTNTDYRRFPLGDLTRSGDEATLTFVRHYPYPVERLWRAITDPEITRLWWAEAEIELRIGGRFNLRWLNGPEEELEWWPGEITALHLGRMVEHTNSVHGLLRWELDPEPGGMQLTFTNVSTPPDEQSLARSLAGWHAHLDHLLEAIEGREPDWPTWHDVHFPAWEDVHVEYQRAYGLR